MKTKHTPGPWKLVDNHTEWLIQHSEPFTLAIIENKWRSTEVNEANAKLIRTAPLMLDFLIKEHEMYARTSGHSADMDIQWNKIKTLIKLATE